MCVDFRPTDAPESPSSRRAWIEIIRRLLEKTGCLVALLAEGVDRNLPAHRLHRPHDVALLAEGVDRNPLIECLKSIDQVALLAEGVDRNRPYLNIVW